MARIRTIKPEFPHSESLGSVSRDARLLFVNLFTIADDDGRARASSRLLASLLYPFDTDAAGLIDGWLNELVGVGAIRLYDHDGTRYLDIPKWLEHQKIDKPSKSRLPQFVEASRNLAKPREHSSADLVPSTEDHGPRTVDQKRASPIEVSALLSKTSAKLNGKSSLPPTERKAVWQTRICREAQLTMPDPEYQRWVIAFAENQPWAKRKADELDRSIKAGKARAASG